jgi:hypothetical protein
MPGYDGLQPWEDDAVDQSAVRQNPSIIRADRGASHRPTDGTYRVFVVATVVNDMGSVLFQNVIAVGIEMSLSPQPARRNLPSSKKEIFPPRSILT